MSENRISLLPDEQLVFQIEADFWNVGNNPLQKALGKFVKTINKILGTSIRGQLIVTNKRVIEVREDISCYCISAGKSMKVVMPHSIKEVGYKMTRVCGLFCPVYTLYYEGHTQSTEIQVADGSEADMVRYIEAFCSVVEC
jgi:hypothetical protein